jgi:hypothetical protein
MLWPWKIAAKDAAEAAAERRADADVSAEERRSNGRLDKVFPVWLEGERGAVHGVARNISPGGLFVESPVTHPIGSQVRVTFTSGGNEMVAVGEVRYVCALTGQPARPTFGPVGVRGMGLRFLYFESPGASGEAVSLH